MTRPFSTFCTIRFARKARVFGLVCVMAVIGGTSTVAGAASRATSADKFSASLTWTSFVASQTGSVKMFDNFDHGSGVKSFQPPVAV